MYLIKRTNPFILGTLLFGSYFSSASADVVEVKGAVTVPYKEAFFSSKPNDKATIEAIQEAKLAALNLYTAKFNDAKMKNYMVMKDKVIKSVDEFVTNVKIIEKVVDKESKSISLVIRASINETALDAFLGASTKAAQQKTGEGTPFVFLFMARQTDSMKSYDEKRMVVTKNESKKGSQVKEANSETTDASSDQSIEENKKTTGGTTERKQSKITYEVSSSQDIDSAMGEVLSTAGFEITNYDDVVANCGGADRSVVSKEFSTSDDMTASTRKSAIQATKDCEVNLFATGTVDIGVHDTDPVSGNKRVYVSVRGQVWNIDSKLPKKVASVGPVQYSGLGPDEQVAKRNALILAAKEAGKAIVDQLNAKGIK